MSVSKYGTESEPSKSCYFAIYGPSYINSCKKEKEDTSKDVEKKVQRNWHGLIGLDFFLANINSVSTLFGGFSLGVLYRFNENMSIEASAGAGWQAIFRKGQTESESIGSGFSLPLQLNFTYDIPLENWSDFSFIFGSRYDIGTAISTLDIHAGVRWLDYVLTFGYVPYAHAGNEVNLDSKDLAGSGWSLMAGAKFIF